MLVNEKILQKAQKEINRLNTEIDKCYREFHIMKIYSADLKEKLSKCKCKCRIKNDEGYNKEECDSRRVLAMQNYTENLKKENEKYAKQKQGQREQIRKTSSKSSKGSRDQSSSSICK